MTRAVKYAGGSANNAGSVDYRREENIFSKYFQSNDALNLLRVDELVDSDSDGDEVVHFTQDAFGHRP